MPNNLRWVAAFLMKSTHSERFQTFMEQTHFKTIDASDCFTGVTRKLFQSGVKEGLDSVVYIHEPKSREHWEKYCKEFRPAAIKEFMDENSDALASGELLPPIQSMGELQVL